MRARFLLLIKATAIAAFAALAVAATAAATPLSPDREHALKPHDTFQDCDACPSMVVVPAGSYIEGDQPSTPEAEKIYDFKHVTFAKPFAIGRFAVTFDEWDACVADGGCNGYRPDDEGWGRGRRPVIHVSFNDAMAYVDWLSHKTGQTYWLPSDAEREYVTRAGTTTGYWWGDDISPALANYNGDYPNYDSRASSDVYRRKTMPVDAFKPNPWGLYQVHGNVWEWVDNCVTESISGTRSCELRGGSWASKGYELTSGSYETNDPKFRGIVGFRVMRVLGP